VKSNYAAALGDSMKVENKGMSWNSSYMIYMIAAGILAVAIIAGIVFKTLNVKKKKRPNLNWNDLPSPLTPSPEEMESSRRSTLNRYYGNERQDIFSEI
jgi:hypothetical protein